MKNKLEQLLNSLIERGWKPFNREKTLHITCYDKCKGLNYKWVYLDGGFMNEESRTLRELVSIDSGLWQFVCENGMYKKEALGIIFNDERAKNVFYKIDQFDEEGDVIQAGDMGGDEFIHISEPEYRLIESSLKDESELEDFLLNNINADE